MVNVIDMERGDVAPIPSGFFRPARTLPFLRRSDESGVDWTRPSRGSPLIVQQRFTANGRRAGITTVYFTEEFSLSMMHGVWPIQNLHIEGNDNEWLILSFRVSGQTLEAIDDRHHMVDANSCYLVRYGRGTRHILRSVSEEPLSEVCLTFSPALIASKLGVSIAQLYGLLVPAEEKYGFSRCDLTPKMQAVVGELRQHSLEEPNYQIFVEAKALELIALYVGAQREQRQIGSGRDRRLRGDVRRLQQVKHYLEAHYEHELRIDDLCRLVGFNRKKLTGMFKQEFGATIQDYHRRIRVEVAKALLQNRGANVTAVAEKVGYPYPGNFSKVFRKYVGMSPKSYVLLQLRR